MSDAQLFWLLYVVGAVMTYIMVLRHVWKDKLNRKIAKVSGMDRIGAALIGGAWMLFWFIIGCRELIRGLDAVARPTKIYNRVIRDSKDLRAVNGGKKKEVDVAPKVQTVNTMTHTLHKERVSVVNAVSSSSNQGTYSKSIRKSEIHAYSVNHFRNISRTMAKIYRHSPECLCHLCNKDEWIEKIGAELYYDMLNFGKYPRQHPYTQF